MSLTVRQAIERFIDDATPAGRCLVAIFASTPFFVLWGLTNLIGVLDPRIQPALRLPVVWGLEAAFAVGSLINAVAGVWLWPRRRHPAAQPVLSTVVTLNIGLVYTLVTIEAGALTAGPNFILLGILVIGLLLFEARTMFVAFTVCTALLLAYDLLVIAGVVPYAPAINSMAFEGGEPRWWWAAWRGIVFYLGLAVIATLVLVLFGRLDALHRKLNKLSYTDVLTGLANRRYFMERLQAEAARQRRTGLPLSLILLDADHFKRINDTHGHAAGDEVLRVLSRILSDSVRTPTDLAARLGGEEFAVLLPDTRLDDAQVVCERIRQRLADHLFEFAGQRCQVSVSMGVSECRGCDAEALLRVADRNLYRAKQEGRDRAIYTLNSEAGT